MNNQPSIENHSSHCSLTKQKPRLDYLDSLRGFTMFLIVLEHVYFWTMGLTDLHPIIINFVCYFTIPVFFFISGLVGLKSLTFWTKANLGKRTLAKSKALLIPTIVFFSLVIMLGIREWKFPGGYWFTLVLFEMFVVYYTTSFIWKHISLKYYALAIIGSIVFVFAVTIPFDGEKFSKLLALPNLRFYYPFFALGMLAQMYKEKFINLLSKDYIITALIILSTALAIILLKNDIFNLRTSILSLLMKIEGAMLLIIVFNCFYRTRDFWAKDNSFAFVFRWVGRRTLDIYMLHYFFVFPTITSLQLFLIENPNEILILFIAVVISIIITGISLLVSSILRTSKFIGNWCFGVKESIKNDITNNAEMHASPSQL